MERTTRENYINKTNLFCYNATMVMMNWSRGWEDVSFQPNTIRTHSGETARTKKWEYGFEYEWMREYQVNSGGNTERLLCNDSRVFLSTPLAGHWVSERIIWPLFRARKLIDLCWEGYKVKMKERLFEFPKGSINIALDIMLAEFVVKGIVRRCWPILQLVHAQDW